MTDHDAYRVILSRAVRESRWVPNTEGGTAPSSTIVAEQLRQLTEAGYSIVRTDDHVSRKAVEAVREAYVGAAAVPGNNHAKWIVEDFDLILLSK